MAMSKRITPRSHLASLLVLAVTALSLTANAHALEIVNKHICKLTVYAPPICEPCTCPQIQCIKAPCIQPDCFCTLECKFVPGVDVKVGGRVTLQLENEKFPLAFLTVEVKGQAFVVKAADLKIITRIATVEVTPKPCGESNQGLVARVFQNPKFAQYKCICLVRGERYGS